MHDGFEGSYPQFPSLPPSGANVNQHLWFDTAHNGEQDDDEDENGQRHLMPEQELGEQDPNPRRVETSVELDADSNDQVSPLATLGQLQSALPDITGSITTE